MENAGHQNKPEAPAWLLENITEASKNASSVYFVYLGLLAYCALTVFSTNDRRLIIGRNVTLPIVNLEVDLDGFFLAVPLITILVFIYFQIYIYRLKNLLIDLKTKYAPVGRGGLYPWILNIAEEPDPGIIGKAQVAIVKLTVWWSLPLVLAIMHIRYLEKHDPISYGLSLFPIFSVVVALFFWHHYEKPQWSGFILWSSGKRIFILVTVLCVITNYWYIIPQVMKGNLPLFNVDLSYQGLVAKPEFEAIYWADFRKVNLRGGNFDNSNLGKANLRETKMGRATLIGANLQKADLIGAELQNASLIGAELQNASLIGADLHRIKSWNTNQLSQAFWDKVTKWPEKFRPPCEIRIPPQRCKWLEVWSAKPFLPLFLDFESQDSGLMILPLPPHAGGR